jgi:hypothetical protein
MKKEFVPYGLALRMKELGFDETCFGCYTKDKELSYDYSDNREEGHYFQDCIAPTFSQAFRWFREKYNLQSEIEFRHCEYSFKINFQKLADGENPPVMVWHLIDSWFGLNMNLFKTYEEAEQACLEKLIQIVENK